MFELLKQGDPLSDYCTTKSMYINMDDVPFSQIISIYLFVVDKSLWACHIGYAIIIIIVLS